MRMDYIKKQVSLIIAVAVIFNIFGVVIQPQGRDRIIYNSELEAIKARGTNKEKVNLDTLTNVRLVLSANREVLSPKEVTSISFLGFLENGSSVDLTLEDFEYKSSNTNVLTLEKSNDMLLATALGLGEAYIMASIKLGEETKTCNIKINVVKITSSKTRSTYYTAAKVEAARANVIKFSWAKKTKDKAIADANKYLHLGYEEIWNLVTGQSVPRSYAVNQSLGCPNCGAEIIKYGHYPYLSDLISEPWKLECPNCHMKFPTNDFKAYYDSGKNLHVFIR